MKVSVVIPVFNKSAHVRAAVESILQGTWRELEVIAVDDHSTDGSLAVLRGIDDPRLRILALPSNVGPAGAANAGMAAARGEYVARLDADDLAVPERIAMQVAFMDAHPHLGGSSGHLRLFGDSTGEWRLPLSPDACRARILFGTPLVQGGSILRRSVLEAHQLRYDPSWPRVGEDWLFWCRLLHVTEVGNLDEVLIHYRRDGDNVSRTSDHPRFVQLLQRVFASFGITITEEEASLHALAMRRWDVPPDAARVHAFKAWLQRLDDMNTERRLFPTAAFRTQLDLAWRGLFHHLPALGTRTALAHLRHGGPHTGDHLAYLVKHRINHMIGRGRNKG